MSTELVTQLVILATAVVGLYKAATYKPVETARGEKGGEPGPVSVIFAGLLSYVGVFGFMLVMPAFIWAFTAITSNIGTSAKKAPEVTYSIPHQVSSKPSTAELLLVAASHIPYDADRRDALVKVVDYSLTHGEEKIAVLSAAAIPYYDARRDELNKVVEVLASMPADPNNPLHPTANAAAD